MINCYEVWHKDYPEHITLVYGKTASKARYDYYLDISDIVDHKFIDYRSRKVEKKDTVSFNSVAKYRGVPEWHCGDEVMILGKWRGWLAGAGCGANFKVIYDDSCPYKQGMVHVSEIERVLNNP